MIALLNLVWPAIRAGNVSHTGKNVVLYHGEEGADLLFCPDGLPIEAGVGITGEFAGDGEVVRSSTPSGKVVTTIHIGPYSRLGEAYEAINEWCKDHNLIKAGPFWELYDHWDDDETKLRTDVFYLLKDCQDDPG